MLIRQSMGGMAQFIKDRGGFPEAADHVVVLADKCPQRANMRGSHGGLRQVPCMPQQLFYRQDHIHGVAAGTNASKSGECSVVVHVSFGWIEIDQPVEPSQRFSVPAIVKVLNCPDDLRIHSERILGRRSRRSDQDSLIVARGMTQAILAVGS